MSIATSRPHLWVLPLVALALLSRRPDAFTNPQFWAEDATIFLQEARTLGLATRVYHSVDDMRRERRHGRATD